MNKQKIVIIVLTSILIIFVNYFVLDKLSVSWQESIIITQRLGYEKGAEDTVRTIFDTTEECNEITVTLANKSKTFIETNCISDFEP